MNKVAYYKEEIMKLAEDSKYNTSLLSGRSRFEEYDKSGDVIKRLLKHDAIGAGAGSLAGLLATKKLGGSKGKNALLGAAFGTIPSAITGQAHQLMRDNKAAEKRYEGNPKAIKKAKRWGPGVADRYMRKLKKEEA